MRDLLPALLDWWGSDVAGALAVVTATSGSAPRAPGAAMAVATDGRVLGSVSGGCVEAAVHELGLQVAASGAPERARYGVGDDPFDVGLTCGGTVEVLVVPFSRAAWPGFGEQAARARSGSPGALAAALTAAWRSAAGPAGGAPDAGPAALLARSLRPPPRLVVAGATDFAAALARAGRLVGRRVTVCDARGTFATRDRFPAADEVVVDWPHRYLAAELDAGRLDGSAALCVLTHDPKFDEPLLRVALERLPPEAYVGAMGSRQADADRRARLRAAGVPASALARLRSPIGLDLGARTPDETAVSIVAEILAHASGASGRPLRDLTGPIHERGSGDPSGTSLVRPPKPPRPGFGAPRSA